MLSPYPPRYNTHGLLLLLQLSQQCTLGWIGWWGSIPWTCGGGKSFVLGRALFSGRYLIIYWTGVCPRPVSTRTASTAFNKCCFRTWSLSQCGLKTAGNSNRRINKVITNRELSDDIYCTTFDRSDVNSVWIRSIVSHWRYCRTSRSLRANREIQIDKPWTGRQSFNTRRSVHKCFM